MIKKLGFIFGSYSKAEEILYLLHNLKEVVRQGFYESELGKVEIFCKDNHLHLVKSNFKVLLADEESSVYSNKGIRVPEKDKSLGMYFVYISKDEKKAWLAAYFELVRNDLELGLLLGYPKCCVDNFCKNFDEKKTNLEINSENIFTNVTKREQDLVLISHFPCSAECSKSIKIGKNNLELIKRYNKNRAEELINGLRN